MLIMAAFTRSFHQLKPETCGRRLLVKVSLFVKFKRKSRISIHICKAIGGLQTAFSSDF